MTPSYVSLFLMLLIKLITSARGAFTVNILAANYELPPNSYIKAADYYLVMHENCDLVLYQNSQPRYRTDTPLGPRLGDGFCNLAMQADANLVIYNGTTIEPNALWSTGSTQIRRKFSYYLLLQTNGSLGLFDADDNTATFPWKGKWEKVPAGFKPPANFSINDPQWSWNPPLTIVHSFMYVGYSLTEGQSIASMNGRYSVSVQKTCNLCVDDLKPGFFGKVWETNVSDTQRRPCQVMLQPTGNVVLLGKNMDVVWRSSRVGNASVNWVLTVDDADGSLAVFDVFNRSNVLWSSLPERMKPGYVAPNEGSPKPGPPSSNLGSNPDSIESPTSTSTFRAILGACIGGMSLLSLAVFFLLCHSRRRRGPAIDPAAKELQKRFGINGGKPTQALSLERITHATNRFSIKIGHGGFGDVFYGKLENGQEVAVKVLSETSHQSKEEFYNEIELLSMVHHKYLVSLIGYCLERKHKILVYEYVKEGDLRRRLKGDPGSKSTNSLTWEQRTSIILQVAEGLEYLHDKCSPAIIHRDVKSNNILLTEKLVAKVADFGLSKLRAIDQESASHVTTLVRGTRGYFDPQYFETGMLTDKSDVYAFGVVMMEILTGQPQSSLVRRVYDASVSQNPLKLADPNLMGDFDEYEYSKLVNLSLWCVKKKSSERPSMILVAHRLRTLLYECHIRAIFCDIVLEESDYDFSSQ